VDVKSQLDLNKAAEMADTPLNEFLKLNPGFNYSSTAPQGPHHLLIPAAKADAFKQNLAQLPYEERVDLKRYHAETAATAAIVTAQVRRDETNFRVAPSQYKVKVGESLATIADRNNTTVKLIRQANHLASDSIHSGMLLKLPIQTKLADAQVPTKYAKTNATHTQVYVVKNGDSIGNVAQRFSVSSHDMADWNKLTVKSALVLGQKLTIKTASLPAVAKLAAPAESYPKITKPQNAMAYVDIHTKTAKQPPVNVSSVIHSISYTVKPGDSLAQISRKFNVSIADLRKWNSPILSNSLTPGKVLKVVLNT
jgi:membrane-bound lytic murein transglycosylase D